MTDVLAVTGHRPDKLGGYGWDVFSKLVRFATKVLREQKPDRVISGMAMGWDMAVAIATIKLRDEERMDIQLTCAIPFSSQYTVWRDPKTVFLYTKILCRADEVVILHRGAPVDIIRASTWLNERNHWMIDECTRLMALWNGSRGGTHNAIHYAMEHACPYVNVWNEWFAFRNQ